MNETQRRIKAYKAALPGLRERVIAVALLLAMSVAMMTSATFAWLTISRAPEVSGVNTTVAANGNLEIALAQGNGTIAPGESKVGDSSATENQTITGANVTWGNLVNLSDPSYGLENLTLRPAQLNTALLLKSPLYGAMYGQDGRITQLSSNFAYTSWDQALERFAVSENLGVRAVSSTKYEAVGADVHYRNMITNAENLNLAAANTYRNLGNNNKYMPSLATMMGLYMTARMNPSNAELSNPSCNIEDIQNLRDMYASFLTCFDLEADAMVALLNLQQFLLHGEGNYEPYTREGVYTTTEAILKEKGLQITGLNQFVKDRNIIASDLEKLKDLCDSGTSLKWLDSGLNAVVNNLVNVGACTIGADNTPISSIGASNAMGYLSGTQEARITNGILYRFEERTGGYIEVKNLGISATVERSGITIPATVKANIKTTAPREYNLFNNDMVYSQSLNDGNFKGGIPVAQDTYGLAIDLWVRTNASNSYLTLEGNVLLSDPVEVQVYGTDANGNQVDIYTVTISSTDEEGNAVSYKVDVYKVVTKSTDESGNETETVTWRKAEGHTALTEEEMGDAKPILKLEEVRTVIGYEGENRIWDDWENNDYLSINSTTQGSGSCYVYYADTPEDQARSLKLLEAFNVAFINSKGELMATAEMDTANHYSASGRVIVPLKLSTSNAINLGEDFEGNITYAITALEKNVATRVTALVYLDGTKLTNDEVLAAADIQGQLNIQFGSSENMNPIGNEDLEKQARTVSASLDRSQFDFDDPTDSLTTTITVNVDGDEPSTVTAFFLRAINATQGSREETMTFTKDPADGNWKATFEFTAPGNYVLRTVRLDGVDYDLQTPVAAEVEGFEVESLFCQQASSNHVNVMTAAASSSVDLTLKFATSDESKMPRTVQGRYLRDEDGSAVNIDFTYNATSGNWIGSGTFLTSGDYTMQYLVLDGEYAELPEGMWQTASITLGMRVAVYTTSPHSFKYVPSEMADNEKLLAMYVKVMDNAGTEMPGLSGVKLTYGMKGSGVKKMDADLTWNGSYYVGELTTSGPGVWQFSNVTVLANTLTNTTTSPTFTILSPEPPEYYAHNTAAQQIKMNPASDPAIMNVQITHSAAASVQAYIIKDGASEGTWVDGSVGGEFTTDGKPVNNWSFTVPKDANGYQDGNWQLTALRLWDVFAEDGTPYTEDEPLEIDVSHTNNVTKVVCRVYPTFATGQSKNFGKDANGDVTAQFMTSHTISGLNADIKDFAGNPIPGVSDVKLTFTYQTGTSSTYGKYTSEQLSNATEGATVTVALDTVNGTNYAQSTDATILYAGSYITTFSFKINGVEYKYAGNADDASAGTKALPANAPVFTVSSKAPVVTVTGVGHPEVSGSIVRVYTVKEPTDKNQAIQGQFFAHTNYTTSVYIYTPPVPTSGLDQEAAHAYTPTVTLALSGAPQGFTSATMQFETKNEDSLSTTFSFASDFTATEHIGKAVDGKRGVFGVDDYPECYPAGKMIQNKMTMVYGSMTYEITLNNAITIDQPLSPAVLRFVGYPEGFPEDQKQGQIMGNGTTVTVKLPTHYWTASGSDTSEGATWTAYAPAKDENGNVITIHEAGVYTYTQSGKGTLFKPYKRVYQYYNWTKFESHCTDTITPYTQPMKIEKWIINNVEYMGGETVALTREGMIIAEAVIETNGQKVSGTPVLDTSYRYLYGYVTAHKHNVTQVDGSALGLGKIWAKDGNVFNGEYTVDLPNFREKAPALANASNQSNMTSSADKWTDYAP